MGLKYLLTLIWLISYFYMLHLIFFIQLIVLSGKLIGKIPCPAFFLYREMCCLFKSNAAALEIEWIKYSISPQIVMLPAIFWRVKINLSPESLSIPVQNNFYPSIMERFQYNQHDTRWMTLCLKRIIWGNQPWFTQMEERYLAVLMARLVAKIIHVLVLSVAFISNPCTFTL